MQLTTGVVQRSQASCHGHLENGSVGQIATFRGIIRDFHVSVSLSERNSCVTLFGSTRLQVVFNWRRASVLFTLV
ncbi:hypothetical protein PSEUDO8O_80093 [Pseudomonas sp. 8O]|nr:hypothetical protein PSEUDO8O_80093 [Pseudomonas sp. 8O]